MGMQNALKDGQGEFPGGLNETKKKSVTVGEFHGYQSSFGHQKRKASVTVDGGYSSTYLKEETVLDEAGKFSRVVYYQNPRSGPGREHPKYFTSPAAYVRFYEALLNGAPLEEEVPVQEADQRLASDFATAGVMTGKLDPIGLDDYGNVKVLRAKKTKKAKRRSKVGHAAKLAPKRKAKAKVKTARAVKKMIRAKKPKAKKAAKKSRVKQVRQVSWL